jgi:tetratricopeptide (TPR) repeat protein
MALGRTWLAMGRAEDALQLIEPIFRTSPTSEAIWIVATLAAAHLQGGDHTRAESLLLEAIPAMRKFKNVFHMVDALRVLGMLRREQSRWEEAEAAFEESLSRSRAMPYPYAEALALLEWGATQARRGKIAEARTLLTEALAGFDRLGAVLDASRARQLLTELDARA